MPGFWEGGMFFPHQSHLVFVADPLGERRRHNYVHIFILVYKVLLGFFPQPWEANWSGPSLPSCRRGKLRPTEEH